MTTIPFIRRSLRHYWRTHLAIVLGVAAGAAVTIGALAVGDSVRGSLREMALSRLGDVRLAIASGDRFFRPALADELGAAPPPPTGPVAAPGLMLSGLAASEAARVSGIRVLGVDERFWRLAPEPWSAPPDGVVLNQHLSQRLEVKVGDSVLLRVERPALMPRAAPLASDADSTVAQRFAVAAVVDDRHFGRFSLFASQVPPDNAYLPLSVLGRMVKHADWANLLLTGGGGAPDIKPVWTLADAGLELRRGPSSQPATRPAEGHAAAQSRATVPPYLELRTWRVFLDPPAARAAQEAAPGGTGILTYFVNDLRRGKRRTPYSMVSAIGPLTTGAAPAAAGEPTLRPLFPFLPPDLADDEIVINDWLREDLAAGAGDTVELAYFVFTPTGELVEQRRSFRVRAVVPLDGPAADPELMPPFPGLAEAKDCRDWKPGIPVELSRIRDKDERYWDDHRGTPKAFVNLRAGQAMWGNRFGALTAVRWPGVAAVPAADPAKITGETPVVPTRAAILDRLNPADFGLGFQPVRAQALAASQGTTDFGGLFVGFSLFLIAAALLLAGLLLGLGMEQRHEQTGLLLAVGLPPRRVRGLLLREGLVLAAVGVAVGTPLGVLYTRAILLGLGTIWSGALAGGAIGYHAEPTTILLGAALALAASALTVWLTIRRQARRTPRELLAGNVEDATIRRPSRRPLWLALVAFLAAGAVLLPALAHRDTHSAAAFFAAGALLLAAWLGIAAALLSGLGGQHGADLTLGQIGLRNAARRRRRSLTAVALLACGSFLVIAIGANRQQAAGVDRRSSGTGGFAFWGQSSVPVRQDPAAPAGRAALGLDDAGLDEVSVVPLRVRAGDDASCLNLNRAQVPPLWAVNPALLHGRGAFTLGGADWRALDGPATSARREIPTHVGTVTPRRAEPPEIPAIGDENTVVWGLGKGLGEVIDYQDERGRALRVRIVGLAKGSILQGGLVISEARFLEHFPSSPGYSLFLVDCPPHLRDAAARAMRRAGEDIGLELTPATRRLADFNAVENAYLSIFQALGGLGLVLGSAGLGLVLARNVLERRGEFALLRAVGYSRGKLVRLVLYEHWLVLGLGLFAGLAAGAVAVLPALGGEGVPWLSLASTVLAMAAAGVLWTALAALLALRGPLLPALRNE